MRRAPRFILECAKTGRFWPCDSYADGHRAARELGLTDYTIEKDAA